eukprot:jgi/Hompol1/1491/HPOL_002718-RA
MAATTPAPATATAPVTTHAEAFEVGWMFVQEYYTFMNRDPKMLHCFYNKTSQFVHGLEGEHADTHLGQTKIHEAIMDLNFVDCKVLVSNVDSQGSLDGGIIVQVLGEMSNNAGVCHKFAQTFFLAVQPNGYYVLNDIFRFLKEDVVGDVYEESDEQHADHTVSAPAATTAADVTPNVTATVATPAPQSVSVHHQTSAASVQFTPTFGQPASASASASVPTTKRDSRSIFLRSLAPEIERKMIFDAFAHLGEIKHVDYQPMKHIAFVEFATVEIAQKAIGKEVIIGGTKVIPDVRRRPLYFRNNNGHRNGNGNGNDSGNGNGNSAFVQPSRQSASGEPSHTHQGRPRGNYRREKSTGNLGGSVTGVGAAAAAAGSAVPLGAAVSASKV